MGIGKKIKRAFKRVDHYALKVVTPETEGKWVTIMDDSKPETKQQLEAGFGQDTFKGIEPGDLTEREPGVYALYAVYKDGSQRQVWRDKVPAPDGMVKPKEEKKEKKEKDEDWQVALGKKLVEQADFSKLQPSSLKLPMGNMEMEFSNPDVARGGGEEYGEDGLPPLQFDGKLPMMMHPGVAPIIDRYIDKAGGIIENVATKVADRVVPGGFGDIQPDMSEGEYEEAEYEVEETEDEKKAKEEQAHKEEERDVLTEEVEFEVEEEQKVEQEPEEIEPEEIDIEEEIQ